MTDYITLHDADVISMDDTTGDIVVSVDHIPEDIADKKIIKIHYVEDEDTILHEYEVVDFDVDNRTANLKWLKQIDNNLLTEAPVVKLSADDLMNPPESPIRRAIHRAAAQEIAEKEAAAKAEIEQTLKSKYTHVIDKMNASIAKHDLPLTTLDIIFEGLVPPAGNADTVAGELVRAIMRILYRDNNDGDKFFEGYGVETCGSSAQYLFDNGFDVDIQNILDDAYRLADDDEKYTDAISLLAEHVVDKIANDNSLIWTANDDDSRDYPNDYIEENQPRYEFEIPCSDDVCTLVSNDVLTSWDLVGYAEDQLKYDTRYEGAEVARPWGHHDTSVTIENLTKEAYDLLQNIVRQDLDGFWGDLVADHADKLDNDEYDDDYDDSEER